MIIKSQSKAFEPITAGVHHAVCQSIIDLGTQESFNPAFKASRKILFIWELPYEVKNFDGVNKPLTISRDFSVSLNKKAALRQMLDSWRGRPFTDSELSNGFDLEKLIGLNCQLNIVHRAGKSDPSKMYANIQGVMPLGKGVANVPPFTAPVYWDIQEDGNAVIPDRIPDWIAEKIEKSREVKAFRGAGDDANPFG